MHTILIDYAIPILSAYEVISRIIPSNKDHTLIGKIFKVLGVVIKSLALTSDFLNRKKKNNV